MKNRDFSRTSLRLKIEENGEFEAEYINFSHYFEVEETEAGIKEVSNLFDIRAGAGHACDILLSSSMIGDLTVHDKAVVRSKGNINNAEDKAKLLKLKERFLKFTKQDWRSLDRNGRQTRPPSWLND